MLRWLLGIGVVGAMFVACGGDDPKLRLPPGSAGAAGEGGAGANPGAGGSPSNPDGQGGLPNELGGEGGISNLAGAPAGGASNGGEGGEAGNGALAGAAGAASGGPVSLECEPGQYSSSEGCQPCTGEPEINRLSCVEAFSAKDVLSDGFPIAVRLTPTTSLREPLPSKADVTYVTPNQTLSHDVSFNQGRYEIHISPGPDDPAEILVQPFTVQGACGDVFTLTDGVRFLHSGGDNYTPTCPDQT